MPAPTEIQMAFEEGRKRGRKEGAQVGVDPMVIDINTTPGENPTAPQNDPRFPSNLNPDRPFMGEAFARGNSIFNFDPTARVPLAEENPENIPFQLVEGQPLTNYAMGFPDFLMGDVATPEAREAVEGLDPISEIGLFPRMFQVYDRAWDVAGEKLQPFSDFLFGPERTNESTEGPGIQAPPYGGGQPGASGSGGASASGSASGREAADSAFSRDVTLPSPADEAITQDDVPTLSRDKLDDFLASLEETGPGEFERDDLDTSRLLNSMGRALAEAGRAPSFGQALLALGTGGTGARAAHTEEQRQLAREHAMRQDEFQRMLAEQAFSGEQMLNESARGALNTELTRDRLEVAQEQRRNQIKNSLGGVEVQGDYLIVNTPEENDDGTMTVKTSIQNIGEKAGSAQARIWTGQGLADMELPEVGGVEMQKRLQQVQSPQHRMDMAVSGMFAIDSAPLSRIQPVRYQARDKDGNPVVKEMSGKRYFEEVVERDVMNNIALELGLDADASESEIRTRLNAMDADPEVFIEDRMLTGIMEHMAANPSFRQSAWQAVGFLDSGNE